MGRLTLFAFALLMLASSIWSARVAQEGFAATPPPPFHTRHEEVDAGVQLFTASFDFQSEPSMQTAGGALVSAAAVAALFPAPGAVIVAGCLGTIGVLMQQYDRTTTAPPLTNTEVVTEVVSAVNAGFADMGRRLAVGFEHMSLRLATVESGVEQLMENLNRVTDIVEDLANPKGLWSLEEKAGYIDVAYHDYMRDLILAQQQMLEAPTRESSAFERWKRELTGIVYEYRRWIGFQFQPLDVGNLLSLEVHDCRQRSALYARIVAARVQLSTMVIHEFSFNWQQSMPELSGLGTSAQEVLNELMQDLVQYRETALELHVPISAADNADCERSLLGRSWSQILRQGFSSAQGIAAGADHVYVLSPLGKVWRAPITGDRPWQERSQGPGGMRVSSIYFYNCRLYAKAQDEMLYFLPAMVPTCLLCRPCYQSSAMWRDRRWRLVTGVTHDFTFHGYLRHGALRAVRIGWTPLVRTDWGTHQGTPIYVALPEEGNDQHKSLVPYKSVVVEGDDILSVPSYDHLTAGQLSTMQCVIKTTQLSGRRRGSAGWLTQQRYYYVDTRTETHRRRTHTRTLRYYVWVEHVAADRDHLYAVSHTPNGVWRTPRGESNQTSAQFIAGPPDTYHIRGINLDEYSIYVIAEEEAHGCAELFQIPRQCGGGWTKVSQPSDGENACMTSIVVYDGYVHGVNDLGKIITVATNANQWWDQCSSLSDPPRSMWITHDVPTADSYQQWNVDRSDAIAQQEADDLRAAAELEEDRQDQVDNSFNPLCNIIPGYSMWHPCPEHRRRR